jgi:hypothetical protein
MGFAGEHALADFRRTVLKMARNEYTPVNIWMDMPLMEFSEWVHASIELEKEVKEAGGNGS